MFVCIFNLSYENDEENDPFLYLSPDCVVYALHRSKEKERSKSGLTIS